MPPAVAADIGPAAGIVAAKALCAVIDRVLALRFIGDHGAENQAADDARRDRAAVTTATAAMATAPAAMMPVLNLQQQRMAVGLALQVLGER
ncbi:MAG TPA: hypothetical protein VIJ17_13865 [Pseudolabrys sp.]